MCTVQGSRAYRRSWPYQSSPASATLATAAEQRFKIALQPTSVAQSKCGRESVAHASKTKPQINKQSNLHQLHLRQFPCLATICHWLPIALLPCVFLLLHTSQLRHVRHCPVCCVLRGLPVLPSIMQQLKNYDVYSDFLLRLSARVALLAALAVVVAAAATTKAMTTGFKLVTTTNSDRNNTSSSNSNKLSRTIAK